MAEVGNWVIALVMACSFLGALASLRGDKNPLGQEFLEGLHAIGPIFVPVAGIMASVPLLSQAVSSVIGPAFAWIGADPALASTSVIATDMGGYQLARALAGSTESWIMAMLVGYTAGATLVFSIPVGLTLLDRRDHPYLALGVMSGILSVPVTVLTTSILLMVTAPPVRAIVDTRAVPDHVLAMTPRLILLNMFPLVIFVTALAAGLARRPATMIRGFMIFGRVMDITVRLVLAASIVEYFTQFFSTMLGWWGFDPIIADAKDPMRALEVAGYIGLMLSGAFPMVYLLRRYLATPVKAVGTWLGMEPAGAAGLLATIANILAMFRLVREMTPRDKVLNIAFSVCAAFLFGDHLAFTANFQPTLVLPVILGKLCGGVAALLIALRLSVPRIALIPPEAHGDEPGLTPPVPSPSGGFPP